MESTLRHFSQRHCWRKVHLYLTLCTALPLLLIAVTGIILAFEIYIRGLINPQTIANPDKLSILPIANIIEAAQKAFPDLTLHMAVAPKSSWHPYLIFASRQVEGERPFFRLYINPYNADITAIQNSPGLALTFIKRIHRNLLLGQPGRYIVAGASFILILVCLVGVYLWWPMRRHTVKRALKKRQRISVHNLSGLVALPLLVIIAFTGITVTFKDIIIPAVFVVTGSAAMPEPPSSAEKVLTPAPVGRIVAQVTQHYPTLTITSISIPKPHTTRPYVVQLRQPGDVHPMGWIKVFYDGNNAEHLAVHDASEQSIGAQYNKLWYPLHTGEVLSFSGAVIWSVVCIVVIYLIYSGLLLWNKGRSKTSSFRA